MRRIGGAAAIHVMPLPMPKAPEAAPAAAGTEPGTGPNNGPQKAEKEPVVNTEAAEKNPKNVGGPAAPTH